MVKTRLVDTSFKKIAVVSSEIGTTIATELSRFTLRKGSWSRMLPPGVQWARRHNILAEKEELPDGVDPNASGSRWIWEELVQSSSFRLGGPSRQRALSPGPRHVLCREPPSSECYELTLEAQTELWKAR